MERLVDIPRTVVLSRRGRKARRVAIDANLAFERLTAWWGTDREADNDLLEAFARMAGSPTFGVWAVDKIATHCVPTLREALREPSGAVEGDIHFAVSARCPDVALRIFLDVMVQQTWSFNPALVALWTEMSTGAPGAVLRVQMALVGALEVLRAVRTEGAFQAERCTCGGPCMRSGDDEPPPPLTGMYL